MWELLHFQTNVPYSTGAAASPSPSLESQRGSQGLLPFPTWHCNICALRTWHQTKPFPVVMSYRGSAPLPPSEPSLEMNPRSCSSSALGTHIRLHPLLTKNIWAVALVVLRDFLLPSPDRGLHFPSFTGCGYLLHFLLAYFKGKCWFIT